MSNVINVPERFSRKNKQRTGSPPKREQSREAIPIDRQRRNPPTDKTPVAEDNSELEMTTSSEQDLLHPTWASKEIDPALVSVLGTVELTAAFKEDKEMNIKVMFTSPLNKEDSMIYVYRDTTQKDGAALPVNDLAISGEPSFFYMQLSTANKLAIMFVPADVVYSSFIPSPNILYIFTSGCICYKKSTTETIIKCLNI